MLTCLTGCDVFIPACSRVDTSVRERGEREAVGALLTSHQHPGLLPLLKFDGAITCGGVRDRL